MCDDAFFHNLLQLEREKMHGLSVDIRKDEYQWNEMIDLRSLFTRNNTVGKIPSHGCTMRCPIEAL